VACLGVRKRVEKAPKGLECLVFQGFFGIWTGLDGGTPWVVGRQGVNHRAYLRGLRESNFALRKMGNFRSKAAGKMVTNESLAARNLTAASRSANVRAQISRPLGAYARFDCGDFWSRLRESFGSD
jgi:hypothetical protein